jgi:hypothetical protein
MINEITVNDFGAVDKKERNKFVKMKSIFVLPNDKKIIHKIDIQEKDLMKKAKDKVKAKGGDIKNINSVGVVKTENKQMANVIKPEIKKVDDNRFLLDRNKKIKRD